MTVYLFPGQGSQNKGMGGTLFDEFAELTAKADAILGFSIKELCLEDGAQRLNNTQYTQPALYCVNALTYYKKLKEIPKKPTALVGHSLGEYNALLAAEVFDFATGLKLVKKRGELMAQAKGGGMAAVIGLKAEDIKNLMLQAALPGVNIANINSYTQVVISGLQQEVAQAQKLCEQAGASMVIPLKVSGAFHSSHMQAAQQQFTMFLQEFKFNSPAIPVIANCSALPYPAPAQQIQENLAQQITSSVRWTESMEYLLAQGETDFQEIGPGMVLAGLLRRIRNKQ